MARYIPSGVGETMNALAQFGQGIRANQNLNMKKAQSQINNLLHMGFSAEDPRMQRALGTITSGGNPLAILGGAQTKIENLQSSQQQTGQDAKAREYGNKAGLNKLAAKNDLIVNQEMLEQKRQERDKLLQMRDENVLDAAMGQEDKIGSLNTSSDLLSKRESLKALELNNPLLPEMNEKLKAELRYEIETLEKEKKANDYKRGKDIASIETEMGKLEKDPALDKVNYEIKELGTLAKKNIEDLRKSGVNISKAQEENLTAFDKNSTDSRRMYGNAGMGDKLGEYLGKTQEELKKVEKDQSDFMQKEKERISSIRKTGGPLTGTETQQREKTRLDFKQLMSSATSIDDMRKKYNDYVTTMHSIDDRYRRPRGKYQPFEREYRSLFNAKKSTGKYYQPSYKGTFTEVMFLNDNGKKVKLKINAKDRDDAQRILSDPDFNKKYGGYSGNAGDILPADNKGRFQSGVQKQFFENRELDFFKNKKEREDQVKRTQAYNQGYQDPGGDFFSVGFTDSKLEKNIANLTGLTNKSDISKIRKALDTGPIKDSYVAIKKMSGDTAAKEYMKNMILKLKTGSITQVTADAKSVNKKYETYAKNKDRFNAETKQYTAGGFTNRKVFSK